MASGKAPGELLRAAEGIPSLSDRERACLQLLSRGHRTGAIASALAIAPVTVELHLRRARLKLRAKTMPEAVARALRYEQIDPV